MIAASGFSTRPDPATAARDCGEEIRRALGTDADGAVYFACVRTPRSLATVATGLVETLGTDKVAGCTAAGVVSDRGEAEKGTAVAAVGFAGGVRARAAGGRLARSAAQVGFDLGRLLHAEDYAAAVVCADPAGFDAEPFFAEVAREAGRRVLVGGVVSTSGGVESLAESIGCDAMAGGLSALLLGGKIEVETVTTHSCRPIGEPAYITDAEGITIRRIGDRTALEALKEALASVPERERDAAAGNLLAGLALDPKQRELGRGDYLIRAIVGLDPDDGSVRVAQPVGPGTRFCFQQRDGATARLDLQERLAAVKAAGRGPIRFGLYFDCLGRGKPLYEEEGVDREAIRSALGAFPLAGFRTNGEIAPAGSMAVMHNFTGVLALFR